MTDRTSRRGVTIVFMAILMTVIIGFAGVAIDLSRLYVMRAQLQTTADATAIAGIVEVKDKRPSNAPSAALPYRSLNTVERQTPTMGVGNVEGGSWDFATNTFTPLASWTDPALNAVRTTASYTAGYTLAGVFGVTTKLVQARAIAALGFVGTTSCLKPWAVSYQTILDKLYPPAGTKDPSYNLTAQDIQTLTAMAYPADSITLLLGNDTSVTPGNIASVQLDGPGDNNYKAAIAACSALQVGPGTWLDGLTGQGSGRTSNALLKFCQDNGGATVSKQDFTCTAQPRVKLAMWDETNAAPGGNLMFRVKYIGVFTVVGFNAGTGGGNKPDQIVGYFSSMASSGQFSANPTPITGSIALVQ